MFLNFRVLNFTPATHSRNDTMFLGNLRSLYQVTVKNEMAKQNQTVNGSNMPGSNLSDEVANMTPELLQTTVNGREPASENCDQPIFSQGPLVSSFGTN